MARAKARAASSSCTHSGPPGCPPGRRGGAVPSAAGGRGRPRRSLALLEGRAFAGPGDDHGHVMQGPAAHGLLQRQVCRGGASALVSSWPPPLGKGLPLAGPANTPILGRIGLPAQGADDYGAPLRFRAAVGRTWTCCQSQDSGPASLIWAKSRALSCVFLGLA